MRAKQKWNTGPRLLVPCMLSDELVSLCLNCNTSNPFLLNVTQQTGDVAAKGEGGGHNIFFKATNSNSVLNPKI